MNYSLALFFFLSTSLFSHALAFGLTKDHMLAANAFAIVSGMCAGMLFLANHIIKEVRK